MKRVFVRFYAVALMAVFSFAVSASAQTSPSQFPNIDIINFGQMTETYYRGGQPEPDDYPALAALGVKTVIDLRNDPTDYEKSAAEAVGMKYINIPMSGWKTPKDSQLEEFLKVMNNPETGTVYVHCKAGKHRTGVTAAVYRMVNEGWGYDQAYKEMKNYNYTSWPVHGALGSYVKSYGKKLEATRAAADVAKKTQAVTGSGN